MSIVSHPASFRDPAGFVFEHEGEVYRAVADSYQEDYRQLTTSGLYEDLTSDDSMIPHEEVRDMALPPGYFLALKPERVPFVSYPYEWSFSQLRDAALLTLEIQSRAVKHQMTLKDASAFNITMHRGRPIFIDTLSFEQLKPGRPWSAYGQFCAHFLAPLALMSHKDIRLKKLLQTFIHGLPLDLASRLLPRRTWFKLSLLMHIHIHAWAQTKHASDKVKNEAQLSERQLENLVEGLQMAIEGLKIPRIATEWGNYYDDTNYTAQQFQEKVEVVTAWIKESGARVVCDLGANDGTFSRLARENAELVLSIDIDPLAVEANYRRCRQENDRITLPLLQDLTQPSPGLGWRLRERSGLLSRLQPEMGMALALVHHLAIGNNTPLWSFCSILADIAPTWIVEFPTKDDSQVKRLLLNRKDVFPNYNLEDFEKEAERLFIIAGKHHITGSYRTLFFLKQKM